VQEAFDGDNESDASSQLLAVLVPLKEAVQERLHHMGHAEVPTDTHGRDSESHGSGDLGARSSHPPMPVGDAQAQGEDGSGSGDVNSGGVIGKEGLRDGGEGGESDVHGGTGEQASARQGFRDAVRVYLTGQLKILCHVERQCKEDLVSRGQTTC
jgi:hypothetical protein